MSEIAYNRGKTRLTNGLMNAVGSDLRMLLLVGALPAGWSNPALNTIADLAAVPGITIHSERIALTGLTDTQDDVNNRANLDSNNVTFAGVVGVTAFAGVIYDQAGGVTDATRFLVVGSSTGFGVGGKPLDGGLSVIVNDWARVL